MAQLVIAASGAAIGGFLSGGNPYAIQAGWAVGSVLGASVASGRQKIQGPRLEDLRVGGSQYGTPIPRTYGSPRVPGQIWWASEKREISTTTREGKGGGPEVTNYTYEVDLLIGLCDNEFSFISRIWSNGKLVFTSLTDATDASKDASVNTPAWRRLEVYTGAETQLPEAIYETAVGSANAPAYRGRGCAFIEGLQLGSSGQLPNLTFELALGQPAYETVLLMNFNDNRTEVVSGQTFGADGTVGYSTGVWGSAAEIDGDPAPSNGGANVIYSASSSTLWDLNDSEDFTIEGRIKFNTAVVGRPKYLIRIAGPADLDEYSVYQESGNPALLQFRASVRTSAMSSTQTSALQIPFTTDWVHLAFTRLGNLHSMWVNGNQLATTTTSYRNPSGSKSVFIGNARRSWIDALDGAIDGLRIVRKCLYTDFFTPPTTEPTIKNEESTLVTNTVRAVVESECAAAGLSAGQYDAAALASITKPVRALVITQVAPVRTTLDQLASAFFFECSLRDKLYFRPRAVSPVETIPYRDLGAKESAASAEPLSLTIANDLELPPQVAVSYANLLDDHQSGTEFSDRLISGQAATQTVQLALGMNPSEAKGIADAIIQDAAASQTSASISLPLEYAHLEAGDVVTVIDEDSAQYRLRLVRKRDESAVMAFEAVFDDQTALTSSQTTDETQAPSSTVTAVADTVFEALDIPILRDADDGPGFYVAAKGTTSNWPGAQIQASIDDVSFTTIAEVNESAIYGTCSTTLGNYSGVGFDEVNSVTVNVGNGELSSSTRDAMLADVTINAMLIGSEVIRFRTATLSSPGVYVLTGLLRGQRGTEWAIATHAASEHAVLLRAQGLRKVSTQSSLIGVARYLRGVTLGTIADANSESFTDTGVALECYSPVDLRATRQTGNDAVLTWKRRTRVATRFTGPAGILVPLGEVSEAYDVELWSAGFGSLLRTYSGLTSATVTYTAAQQVADGGSVATAVNARVYQLSATVGRGTALQASLTLPSAGGVGSSLSPQLFAASDDGWLACSERFENSGISGRLNDLRVTTFWKSDSPQGPYTSVVSVTTETVDLESLMVNPVLGVIAQTDDYVLKISQDAGGRFIRVPRDLSEAPDLVSPSIDFASPRAVAAESSRFLLFGESSQVYESADCETWSLLGAMAGTTFPHVIGASEFLGVSVSKIGSRWFLSFGLGGGSGATSNRLFYTDNADARTGWAACTGITVGDNASLHEEVAFDGAKHYAAVTNLAIGTTDIYASTDGGVSFALEYTATSGTGFETGTSGTTAPFMAAFQVTGTSGGTDYVRAYMLNGVVFEKLVGSTSWSAKAHGLVNPSYFVGHTETGASPTINQMAALDNASVFSGSGSQVRYETNGVFSLASGFGA